MLDLPDFMFNKKTSEIVKIEETYNDGAKITRYRPDRVIYEDHGGKDTTHNFVEIMEDLEDQGFKYIRGN